MPKLNRRRFLQVATAAGFAPIVPALPARATIAAPAGLTASQMLWGSLHARAGSMQNLGSLTRSMGISTKATQGIYARVIQNHAVTAHGASSLARVARPAPTPLTATPTTRATSPREIKIDLDRLLDDDISDEIDVTGEETIIQTEV